MNTRLKLSLLWLVMVIFMAYADILSSFIPEGAQELSDFSAATGMAIADLMLMGAVIVAPPILMIYLVQVLKHGLNRWLNVIVALFKIVTVIGGGTLLPHYLFIATIEVVLLLLIIHTAWGWKSDDADQQ